MRRNALTILLAEDDDGHAVLVERHLRRAGVNAAITRTCDGQDALDFVRGEGTHDGRTPEGPLLVLLDIRMPRVDGVEVLRRLKASPDTCGIPVLMLTTSDSPREVARCYELGCSLYVTKPVASDALADVLHRLGHFLAVVTVADEATVRGGSGPA